MYLTLHLKLSKAAKLSHMHQRPKTSKESIYQLCLLLRLELCTCLYCIVPVFSRMFLQFIKVILNFNPILKQTPRKKKSTQIYRLCPELLCMCHTGRTSYVFIFRFQQKCLQIMAPHLSASDFQKDLKYIALNYSIHFDSNGSPTTKSTWSYRILNVCYQTCYVWNL